MVINCAWSKIVVSIEKENVSKFKNAEELVLTGIRILNVRALTSEN